MSDDIVSLVILGANGDLARRKLVPAVFSLYCKGRMPEAFHIIGFSRTAFSDDEFRDSMWKSLEELTGAVHDHQDFNEFAKRLFYVRGDLGGPAGIARLKDRLQSLEGDKRPANRVFYLAIAPHLYEQAIQALEGSRLSVPDSGWRRMVIEKPFGFDLESAVRLNRAVNRVFPEDEVYRIDHYLGKETVQNLMVLRFANTIFEPVWNRNYIKNVQITVEEEVDVADRAEYYDRSGVIRDMVQNHLLQLLTLVAMEPPSSVVPESLRDRRVDVLRAVRRPNPEPLSGDAVPGQYDGYRDERGVDAESQTATYAAMRLFVDNWRWNGIPFYLRTGKAMRQKLTEIIIEFQSPPQLLFPDVSPGNEIPPSNTLAICIQPDEGARLQVQMKVPDRGLETRSADMVFHYASSFSAEGIPEAYERLLQDAIYGDASLFIRSDQIEEAWRLVDPINQSWESDEAAAPFGYARGSDGPREADALLAEHGDEWVTRCGRHRGS